MLAASISMTAFAAWETKELDNSFHRAWISEDGTYATNEWKWINSNGDGTAACFYFDETGNAMMNKTTPDGYKVDKEGRWFVPYCSNIQGLRLWSMA